MFLFVPNAVSLQAEAVNFQADLWEISLMEAFTPASQAWNLLCCVSKSLLSSRSPALSVRILQAGLPETFVLIPCCFVSSSSEFFHQNCVFFFFFLSVNLLRKAATCTSRPAAPEPALAGFPPGWSLSWLSHQLTGNLGELPKLQNVDKLGWN